MKLIPVMFVICTLGLGFASFSAYNKSQEDPILTDCVIQEAEKEVLETLPDINVEQALYLYPPTKDQVIEDLNKKKVQISTNEIVAFNCDHQENQYVIIDMIVETETIYNTRPFLLNRKYKERNTYNLRCNYVMQDQTWVLKSIE